MPSPRYLFISGLNRSGRSLISDCLAQHPDIGTLRYSSENRDEAHFFQSVYPGVLALGGVGRFGFRPEAYLTEQSSLLTEASSKQLIDEWHRHWDLSKTVLMQISADTMLRSRFLQAVFPDSHFHFIVRHPAKVAMESQPSSRTGIYSLIHHWIVCHDVLRRDLRHLRSYSSSSYEAFIRTPTEILRNIESRLGLDRCAYKMKIRLDVDEYFDRLWFAQFLKKSEPRADPPVDLTPRQTAAGIQTAKIYHNVTRKSLVQINYQYPDGPRSVVCQQSFPDREAQDAVDMFEARAGDYGYSFRDLSRYPESPFPEPGPGS